MAYTASDLESVVRAAVTKHRHRRGPLVEILHEVQHLLGYVDLEVVPLLARELNLSRADVYGVLTFYKDFRTSPPGRVQVQVCRAEACQALGAEKVVSGLEQCLGIKTGQTTPDGAVTLEQAFCFGNCALSPAAQINGRLYGRVDSTRIVALVEAANA